MAGCAHHFGTFWEKRLVEERKPIEIRGRGKAGSILVGRTFSKKNPWPLAIKRKLYTGVV
jgi:hypothetical protein